VPLDIDLFSLEFSDFYENCFLVSFLISLLTIIQKIFHSILWIEIVWRTNWTQLHNKKFGSVAKTDWFDSMHL
jgi:hypothetical protein